MTNIKEEYLTRAEVEDLKNGFFHDSAKSVYTCLSCGKDFNSDEVYSSNGRYLMASKAVRCHIADLHGDSFLNLLDLGKDQTGISEAQEAILRLVYKGRSDKDIASMLGGRSASTVRNHRFQLRKKVREAKLFLAVMGLLEEKTRNEDDFVDFHGDLSIRDERTVVTEDEASGFLKKYFEEGSPPRLRRFPKKQKEKLVVLNRLSELFDAETLYTEKEINEILLASCEEYVTVRRYLIDYGFLGRKPDGSEYWRR